MPGVGARGGVLGELGEEFGEACLAEGGREVRCPGVAVGLLLQGRVAQ
jgi:hypothetical protein